MANNVAKAKAIAAKASKSTPVSKPAPVKAPKAPKMTDARDDRMDAKAGIKEGSKRDMALDKKRGVPENDAPLKPNTQKLLAQALKQRGMK